MLRFTAFGILLFTFCALAQDGAASVGYRILDTDHTLDGQQTRITTALWYPTETQPKEHVYSEDKKVRGRVAVDAPMKAGKWPLLLFSHGYSGGGIGSVEITEAFAAHGWIVASPDHHDAVMSVRIRGASQGNLISALQQLKEKPFTEENYRYRPQEVRAVLNAVLEREDLNIDKDRIALMGHSMGGWSVMKVAMDEPRIKAAVLLSMGELNWLFGKRKYFEADQLAALKIPTVYFFGSKEAAQNPQGAYARFCYEHSPAPTYLVEIPDANHFVYNSKAIAMLSGGTPRQFESIQETMRAFLDRHVLQRDVTVPALESKITK